jgi:cbb3-type cytochrome oxidase subunit 3
VARLLLILALLAVVFWVYSVIDCAVQPPFRHRGVRKGAWVAIVILLPVVGGVLWFVLGRGRRDALAAAAPDDDPEFLRRLGSQSDQDERIRRLEEDLARLDGEEPGEGTDAAHRRAPDADDDGSAPHGRV